ncbi:MAG: NrtR DNA-binding winged helix domain-containing protein, partial [Cellulosilyticaceae bacterium]
DHSKIIALAMERLKGKIEYTDVAFYLAPTYFTLTGLQKIYELVLGKIMTPANFRRKIADMVEETEEVAEGGGYRNAKLFRRKENYF